MDHSLPENEIKIMHSLKDKKALFIGQVFYDYHTKIIQQLTNAGATVTFIENKIFQEDPAVANSLLHKFRRLLRPDRKGQYGQQILQKIAEQQFDFLFCIGGFSITKEILDAVRKKNAGIKCILYIWDSFSIYNYKNLIPLFDAAFSFDPIDCENVPGLKYLPLFYTDEFDTAEPEKTESSIDLVYIGSVGHISVDRCTILSKLEDEAKRKGYTYFFWLYLPEKKLNFPATLIHKVRRIFSPKYNFYCNTIQYCKTHNSFITNKTLSRNEVAGKMANAECIIDIPVPGQAGLTIRTIEALAQGKKILTSNVQIVNEPFYTKQAIAVLDINSMETIGSFIKQDAIKLSMTDLHIKNWIRTIFTAV